MTLFHQNVEEKNKLHFVIEKKEKHSIVVIYNLFNQYVLWTCASIISYSQEFISDKIADSKSEMYIYNFDTYCQVAFHMQLISFTFHEQ